MKRLYYFRHSIKDGEASTLGPKGLELANLVGAWVFCHDHEFDPALVFTGPLVRTVQTAYAFMQGVSKRCGGSMPILMPAIPEIGDDALFAEMVKPAEQFRALAGEMGNYRALLTCHDGDVVDFWIVRAMEGLKKMVGAMEEVNCAVVFGHSPIIELTLAGILGKQLPEELLTFSEMEGVLLTVDGDGKVNVIVHKISMPAQA